MHSSFLCSLGFLEMLFYPDGSISGHRTAGSVLCKRSPVFLLQLLDATVTVSLPSFTLGVHFEFSWDIFPSEEREKQVLVVLLALVSG